MSFLHNPTTLWGWTLHGIGGAATVLLAVALHWFVGRPLDREAAALRAGMAEAGRLLTRGAAIRSERDLLRQRAAAARDEIRIVLERIPDTARESDFLAQLTDLANRVGLHVVDFRPGPVSRHADYSERTIDLVGRGEYASLCRFLDGLNELARLSTTVTMQVDSSDGSGPYPLRMTLKIYFAPGNTSVALTGAPDRG